MPLILHGAAHGAVHYRIGWGHRTHPVGARMVAKLLLERNYYMECTDCAQFTENWQKKWGCIGNPDNGNKGCPYFIKKEAKPHVKA